MSSARPSIFVSVKAIAEYIASSVEKSTYAKPLFVGLVVQLAGVGFVGGGMWTRVICSLAISVLSVKNFRSVSLVADHGRLPIQTPYAERCAAVSLSSLAAPSIFATASGPSTSAAGVGFSFAFFALRAAFFDAGSGRLMSISSSSGSISRLRFFAGVSASSSVASACATSAFDSVLERFFSFFSFFSFFFSRRSSFEATATSSAESISVSFDIVAWVMLRINTLGL
ncbi:hypothetical protein CUC08_Gglean011138 [Alternaria sp. MG1]|nr:hypothetical protein CUC08_Gglean011138 [Alternaria sp. MG1]